MARIAYRELENDELVEDEPNIYKSVNESWLIGNWTLKIKIRRNLQLSKNKTKQNKTLPLQKKQIKIKNIHLKNVAILS